MLRSLLSICLVLLLTTLSGRAQAPDADEERYSTVTTYGVNTNTNSGILGGFAFRHSKALPGTLFGKRQFRYLSIEVVNVKHPKEIQQQTAFTGGRFIPGKQNYLFVIRPQYGREIQLFTRTSDEGIAVNGILAAGPSLGIIKPYYIQYMYTRNRVAVEPYDPAIHTGPEAIQGAGSFFQGFSRSKLTVGLNLKAAVAFELSAFRNNMTGLEVGFLAEAFPSEIIIMPFADNRQVFTSGYVTLFFGNKR